MKMKILAVAAILLITTGCATNIAVMQADPQKQQQAMSFSANTNSAKVYFVGGKTKGHIIKQQINGGAILFIDGVRIGQIDKNDVMVFDLKPKQYSFAWQYPSGDSQMHFLQRDVKAGDVIILEATWNWGGAPFGLIGLMVSPTKYEINETYDRSLIAGKRILVPQSCPNTICD